MNQKLTINQDGQALMTQGQRLLLQPQRQPNGDIIIGYGHVLTGDQVNLFKSITQEQADKFLQEDIRAMTELLRDLVTVPLNTNQFSALASWAMSVGKDNLHNSTLLRWLNQERFQDIPGEILRWHRIGPRKTPSPDLIKRRAEEALLFMKT